jgi:hypothetical protein
MDDSPPNGKQTQMTCEAVVCVRFGEKWTSQKCSSVELALPTNNCFWGGWIRNPGARTVKDLRELQKQGFWAVSYERPRGFNSAFVWLFFGHGARSFPRLGLKKLQLSCAFGTGAIAFRMLLA